MPPEPGSALSSAVGASPAPVPELAARDARAGLHGAAVRNMFDRIAPTYDLLNRLLSLGIDRRWRTRALAMLSSSLPPGPVLDVCAGTLDLSAAIQSRFGDRRLWGADFARDMLVAGRPKLTAPAGLAICDAMRLPFRSGAFAGLVCGFGMRNLADPRVGLAEAHRVLAPGGVCVVLEFFRPTRVLTRLFHAVYARGVLPLVGRLVSGGAGAYSYLSRSMVGFLSREEFAGAMADAGFRQVDSLDLSLGVASLVRGVK